MRYIIKELLRHSARTIVSITGYAIATLFIIIILSITGSGKADSFGILKSTGTHFILYIPTDTNCCSCSSGDGSLFAEGIKTMMLDNGLLRTIRNIDGIKDAAPCLLYKMYNDKFKSDISIGGIDTASIASKSNACAVTNVIAGKYLSGSNNEIVAEESFANAHGLSLGDTLDIFGNRMSLAGIVNSGIKPVRADFYAPIEIVRTILKDKLQCNSPSFDMNVILVEAADARRQDIVIGHIKNLMYKFSVSTYNCYQPAGKVMSIIDKSSKWITLLIFLFLIVFSVKTQLASLMERFREIGILKSLGWSDFSLGTQVLFSSFIQAITGVTAGLLLGIIAVIILNRFELNLPGVMYYRYNISSIPFVYSLSLAGAFCAAIFPIVKIYRSKAGEIIKNFM